VQEHSDHDYPDEEDSHLPCQRAPRHSKSHGILKPTTLAYYPGHWQEVQTRVKKKMGHFVASYHAFPTHEKDLDIARHCIMTMLAEFEAENRMVESGVIIST
jgi:hypothetical protein